MRVTTATGSTYEVDDDTMTRLQVGKDSVPLRKDGETVFVQEWVIRPTIGQPMIAVLFGVSHDPNTSTVRRTSVVTQVVDGIDND